LTPVVVYKYLEESDPSEALKTLMMMIMMMMRRMVMAVSLMLVVVFISARQSLTTNGVGYLYAVI
jgi:heme/copper-type cytochrome/quinol oxidase subunit 2